MLQIAFYIANKGHWWDKLIGFRTGSRYSHCEFLFSDGMCYSASPREGCCRFKRIAMLDGKWYVVPVADCTAEMEHTIRAWCKSMEGAKYDWPGIVGISAMAPINVPKWYFCSEALTTALQMNAEILTNLNPDYTSPGTLETALKAWNAHNVWIATRPRRETLSL